ncbi:MAG: matrixin family metalloprotease, partial [Planctomycetes bacterium]|nr:matrixin family metalloprotease [Planctomycetota bacterium]
MRYRHGDLRSSIQPIACVATIFLLFIASCSAKGDVIVLANRVDRPMPIRFAPTNGAAQQLTLPVGDVVPLFVDGKASVEFSTPSNAKRYSLDANCAYYFGRALDGRIDLQKIGLGEDGTALAGRQLAGKAVGPAATITVKICVDDEEPARRAYWERRLRRRIETASAILEKFCGVKLDVVATEVWNSDNATNDLIESLGEFEREVSPAPARVAIGFSSQYQMVRGRTHMAGTRGPLHSHILAREGSPEISEPEKLEFLVHELGHFLGAAHSPERGSVMRPVLGDNRAGRSDFRIQFDPVNALAVAMVGEEIRRRNIKHISELEPETKRRLKQIYTELARSLPEDP